MVIGLISAVMQATALRRADGSSAAALPHSGTGPERPGAGENGALDPADLDPGRPTASTRCPPDHL